MVGDIGEWSLVGGLLEMDITFFLPSVKFSSDLMGAFSFPGNSGYCCTGVSCVFVGACTDGSIEDFVSGLVFGMTVTVVDKGCSFVGGMADL